MTRRADGLGRPRWEVERDRLDRELVPLQAWIYRQGRLYAVAGVGFVAVSIFDP